MPEGLHKFGHLDRPGVHVGCPLASTSDPETNPGIFHLYQLEKSISP